MDAKSAVPRGEPKSLFEEGSLVQSWFEPTWSADGRKLHFRRDPNGTYPVAVERDIRTGEERITRLPTSHQVDFFDHSPDDRSIAFYGMDEGGRRGIYEYRRETGNISPLWKTKDNVNPPLSWSPAWKSNPRHGGPGKQLDSIYVSFARGPHVNSRPHLAGSIKLAPDFTG